MTDKARELLERALEELIFQNAALRWDEPKVIEEIRAYLAEPEVNPFVRLSEREIMILAKRYDIWTHVIRAIEDALEEKNK